MANINPLPTESWPQLYALMAAREFPDLPASYNAAVPYFKGVSLYAITVEGRIVVAFIFGKPEDGVCFMDVVCATFYGSRWATPGVVRKLFALAFEEMGLRCLWVQTKTDEGRKAALQAGFVAATPLNTAAPVLVMTPGLIPKKFK